MCAQAWLRQVYPCHNNQFRHGESCRLSSSGLGGLKMEAQRSCSHLPLQRKWSNGEQQREQFPVIALKPWAAGPKCRSILLTTKFLFCINYYRLTFLLITTERLKEKCLYLQKDCCVLRVSYHINTRKHMNSLGVHVEKKYLNDYRSSHHITEHRVSHGVECVI